MVAVVPGDPAVAVVPVALEPMGRRVLTVCWPASRGLMVRPAATVVPAALAVRVESVALQVVRPRRPVRRVLMVMVALVVLRARAVRAVPVWTARREPMGSTRATRALMVRLAVVGALEAMVVLVVRGALVVV